MLSYALYFLLGAITHRLIMHIVLKNRIKKINVAARVASRELFDKAFDAGWNAAINNSTAVGKAYNRLFGPKV